MSAMMAKKQILIPASFLIISLVSMVLLMLLTSPVKKIGYAVVFFGILSVALISLGYLIVRIWGGQTTAKNRYRIIIVSLFITISLMFRSAQSFNWVDLVIVVLVTFGLLFYGGRRF